MALIHDFSYTISKGLWNQMIKKLASLAAEPLYGFHCWWSYVTHHVDVSTLVPQKVTLLGDKVFAWAMK